MKQDTKARIGDGLLLGAKILTVILSGYDTILAVTQAEYTIFAAFLSALVLDGAFAALWWIASNDGESQEAVNRRPKYLAGACFLYFIMIALGFSVSHNIWLSLGIRASGLFMLALDWADVWYSMNIKSDIEFFDVERYRKRILTKQVRKAHKRAANRLYTKIEDMIYEQQRDYMDIPGEGNIVEGTAEVIEPEPAPTYAVTVKPHQGQFIVVCECGFRSLDQKRGKLTYANTVNARNAANAHARSHEQALVSVG